MKRKTAERLNMYYVLSLLPAHHGVAGKFLNLFENNLKILEEVDLLGVQRELRSLQYTTKNHISTLVREHRRS